MGTLVKLTIIPRKYASLGFLRHYIFVLHYYLDHFRITLFSEMYNRIPIGTLVKQTVRPRKYAFLGIPRYVYGF